MGALLDVDAAAARWAPFAVLAALGASGGAVILVMQRRRLLDPVPHDDAVRP